MMITAMRFDRVLIQLPLEFLLSVAPWYVLASDGIYVPKCDLTQYEEGRRLAR